MKKRILSFLLAFVMVLGMIPANLFGMHVSAAALDGNEIQFSIIFLPSFVSVFKKSEWTSGSLQGLF